MPATPHSGRARGTALTLLLLAAAGCAGQGRFTYEKPRTSPAQIDHDMTACRKEAPSHNPFRIFLEEKVEREAFNRCMKNRGYDVKPAS